MRPKGFLVQWLHGLGTQHLFLGAWLLLGLILGGVILMQLRRGTKRNFRPGQPGSDSTPRRNLDLKTPAQLSSGKQVSGGKRDSGSMR